MTTPKIDLYIDAEARWRWRFVAGNGRILADSGQGYTRRIDCVRGMQIVTGLDECGVVVGAPPIRVTR